MTPITEAPLTEAYVDALAPNAAAIKNGRDLAKKKKFLKRCRSEDGTLLFGECQGSGKSPYACSVDFMKPDAPVFRCTCPSRQFPCKHNLGLLYALTSGEPFEVEAVPADLADKRAKAEQREEKKQEAAAAGAEAPPKPKKTNKAAQAKKIAAQLEGARLLEKLVRQIAHGGMAAIDAKMLKLLDEQAKQLGDKYVPGLQHALRDWLELLREAKNDREPIYTEAMDRLSALHVLAKKSIAYLTARHDDPDAPVDAASTLEEAIGHAWQLAELRELGRARAGAALVQLAFRSYADAARKEYVDEGFWLDCRAAGPVYTTRTYRPFRAAKYIKEDDSCFTVVQPEELLVYPGDLNPRVRWDAETKREPSADDWAAVRAQAQRSFAEAVKAVKNQLKNPLDGRHPAMLLWFVGIERAGERLALVDEAGNRLALGDLAALGQPTTQLLSLLRPEQTARQAALVIFGHELDSGELTAQPLSLVTERGVVRLLY